MTLESLVPDRSRCEQLRDAGMPQKTVFVWYKNWEDKGWYVGLRPPTHREDHVAAPLTDELLRHLPKHLSPQMIERIYNLYDGLHTVSFHDMLLQVLSSPNALADLLLWAVRGGYVKW